MEPLNDIFLSSVLHCTGEGTQWVCIIYKQVPICFIKHLFFMVNDRFFFRTIFKETNFIPPSPLFSLVPLSLFSWGFPISPWLASSALNFQQVVCLCSTVVWMSQHVCLRSFKELNESKEDHWILESVSLRVQKRMEFSPKHSSLIRVGKWAECVHRCLHMALTAHRTS